MIRAVILKFQALVSGTNIRRAGCLLDASVCGHRVGVVGREFDNR